MATLKLTATLEAERTTLPGPMLTLTTRGAGVGAPWAVAGRGEAAMSATATAADKTALALKAKLLSLQLTWRNVPRRRAGRDPVVEALVSPAA